MRLYEISSITKDQLTPKVSPRTDPNDAYAEFGVISPVISSPSGESKDGMEEIGSGMYSTAFSTKQEPGTVRKVVAPIDDLESDAYFQYIQVIAKNDRMLSNPYFPKIFNIEVKQFWRRDFQTGEKLGKEYGFAVDIERLLPYSELSQKEAQMLGNRMFYEFERTTKPKDRTDSREEQRDYLTALVYRIEAAMEEWTRDEMITTIKDSRFKQAVMLIKNLDKKEEIGLDLHADNIMIRRGPVGPQIVITDPVQNL